MGGEGKLGGASHIKKGEHNEKKATKVSKENPQGLPKMEKGLGAKMGEKLAKVSKRTTKSVSKVSKILQKKMKKRY